jgi:hypothetical protein
MSEIELQRPTLSICARNKCVDRIHDSFENWPFADKENPAACSTELSGAAQKMDLERLKLRDVLNP